MPVHPGQDRKINRLLEGIHNGEFAIPLFQRGFEWEPNQVKDLLTSIVAKYFSGLLLFWALDRDKVSNDELQSLWGARLGETIDFAVLDGQQRLSSLYFSMYNPPEKFPNKQSYYLFYLDLRKCIEGNLEDSISYSYSNRHSDIETLKSRKYEYIKTCKFPLALLSDKDFLETDKRIWNKDYAKQIISEMPENDSDMALDDFDKQVDLVNQIDSILMGILNYEFTTHVLGKENDTKDVCLMFARLNQKGLKLSMFDLMNAFLYRKGVSLRKSYDEEVNEKLKKIGQMDEYLLKTIALIKRDYSSPKYVYSLVPGNKDTLIVNGKKETIIPVKDSKEFVRLWNNSIRYNELARKKVQNVSDKSFGAVKSDYIPNTTTIPVLATVLKQYAEKNPNRIVENTFDKVISKWYWSAVLSRDYSGSSDSVMSSDYRELKKWIQDDDVGAIKRISESSITRIIQDMELSNVKKGTSVYNAVISMLALKRAEDFFEQYMPGSGDYSDSSINDHHLFPSKVVGLPPETSKLFEQTKNNILNRTLLLDSTNIKINNQKPSIYVKLILEEKFV